MRHALPSLLLLACAPDPAAGESGAPASQPAADSADSASPEVCDIDLPSIKGCVVDQWTDPDADGYYPDVLRVQYDGQGRVVSTAERSGLETDGYTICGNAWHRDSWLDIEWCTGGATYTYAWSYDEQDHPAGKVYDAGSDGVTDKVWVFEADADGRIVRELQDQDLDGETDSTTDYVWDGDGRLVEERWDYDANGAPDYIRATDYDADGNVVLVRIDGDGDGTWDRSTTTTRAPDGRPLREDEDVDGDGSADASVVWRYTDCLLDQVETTSDDGVRSVSRYSWSADGRVEGILEDFNDDGRDDRVRWFVYACPG